VPKNLAGEHYEPGVPFYPHHVLDQLMVVYFTLAVLLALVLLFPTLPGPKADPFQSPEHPKPEWYFLPMYMLLKIKFIPKTMNIVLQGVALAVIFFWPLLDRSPERNPARRPLSAGLGLLVALSAIALIIIGRR